MILYKSNLVNMMQNNIIMLEVEEEEGYIYLSKHVYDQAILIFDRLEGEITQLKRKLVGEANMNHLNEIEYFYNIAPEPLNILAPFLCLIREDVELKADLRELCGVLHMLSMTIDFDEFTKVPAEVRKNVVFTKSMVNKYEQSWKDTEVKLKLADIDLESLSINAISEILNKIVPYFGSVQSQSVAPMQMVPNGYVQQQVMAPVVQEIRTLPDKYYIDTGDGLTPEQRAILDPENPEYDFVEALKLSSKLSLAKSEEEAAEKEAEEEEKAQAAVVEKPEEPEEEKPKILSKEEQEKLEIDNLINLMSGKA